MSEKEIHPSNWKFRLWYWGIMLVLFIPFGAMGPLGWILWALLLSATDPVVRGLLRLIGKSQGYRVNFDGPSEEKTAEAAAEVAAKSRDEVNTAIASLSNWAEIQARQIKENHLPTDKEAVQVAVAKATDELKVGALQAFAWGKQRLDEIEKKRQELRSQQECDRN